MVIVCMQHLKRDREQTCFDSRPGSMLTQTVADATSQACYGLQATHRVQKTKEAVVRKLVLAKEMASRNLNKGLLI